jgi:hypothetical protein
MPNDRVRVMPQHCDAKLPPGAVVAGASQLAHNNTYGALSRVGSSGCSHWQMVRMHNKPLVPTRNGEAPVLAVQRRLATRAQIGLSILVGLFLYVTSLDANGPMLWVFYLPLSAVLLLVVAFTLPSRVSMPAGSDKRHT